MGTLLLVGFQVTQTAEFINRRVLYQAFSGRLTCLAGLGNDLYIDLNTLAGKGHLLVWFGFVRLFLGFGLQIQLAQNTVKSAERPAVSTLAKPAPQLHSPQVRIAPAHIPQQLDLLLSVLIWMVTRPAGSAGQ